jgi:catechol 2,3-dioxygenase
MRDDEPTSLATGDREPQAAYGIAAPGYRLPALRLGPVRLQVSNLSRSLDYYRDVLGLAVIDQTDTGARLGAAGTADPLVELRERRDAKRVGAQGRLGLYHYAILLPDRAALGRFVVHLGRNNVRAGAADHHVSEALYLNDPDGLGIEVYADRPRGEWLASEGQLRMVTDPLDIDDVVRAGGDEPWTGMPPGTTMGHVHLHVGDLPEARAFYHVALGFDAVVWGYPGALFLSAGGYHHHLGLNTWARGAQPARPEDARLLEWEIVLPDREQVAAAAASVRGAGYDVTSDGDDVLATDPWGTVVRLRAADREEPDGQRPRAG